MAEMRIGPRLTLKEQLSRDLKFKGRLLAIDMRTPYGRQLRVSDVIGRDLKTIEQTGLFVDRLCVLKIIVPKMISITEKVSIMQDVVTVGLFKKVMEGYDIAGEGANELQAILNDPEKENEALTYVSLLDAKEFAKRLSFLTGKKFRVQTDKEWEAAGNRLKGENWTWTTTKSKMRKGAFMLRRLETDPHPAIVCNNFLPGSRFDYVGIRLVEDQ